ncbi:MAG: RnfABCDGE type electron transport complex subunit B [Epulopiscium sp.]|nr:RnfABCDGE type electron transport complex subunit B [Candidatus Epulonipiscium sp.]
MDITSILYPAAAISGLGLVFGAGLGFAAQKFAVEVDEKVEMILEKLPGANCGGCGYAGCEAFANAVAEGQIEPSCCFVNDAESTKAIGSILGKEVKVLERQRAMVACRGTDENAKEKNLYYGITDCRDAALIPGGGSKSCSYGCLGLGSCVEVCVFGAMSIKDGVAVVDPEKCTACGTCVRTCPKHIIHLIPAKSTYHVNCMSEDKGKDAKSNCKVACIGCGICVRNCEAKAITMKNKVACIDNNICVDCGVCEEKCPTKAITQIKSVG